MPAMRQKADLPEKTCPTCNRPFAWRRKWARDWPQVRFCSERCRRPARYRPQATEAQNPR